MFKRNKIVTTHQIRKEEKYLQNNNKLRGLIYEKYKSINAFARAIDKNASSVNLKILGKRPLQYTDIKLYSKALGIKKEEIGDIFF